MSTPNIQAYPQHSGLQFLSARGSEHGNLIGIHLRPPDEVVPSNETALPAFCLLVFFYIPAISSALGGKLDVHNDQMNLQIAYYAFPLQDGGRDRSVGVHEGKSWGEWTVLSHLCWR